MRKFKQFLFNNYLWLVWFVIVFVLAFFIVHNAQWLIGDDAIIISNTGRGKAFSIFSNIIPESGRFFPLAYYVYNILLFFNQGRISVEQHYILIATGFTVFSFIVMILNKEILKEYNIKKTVSNLLVILFSLMIIQRSYSTFSNIFTTIWVDYLLLAAFLLFTFKFFQTQKYKYAIVALFAVLYSVFCLENIFIIPLSVGVLLLLFSYKNLSFREKVFSYSLIAISLLFLVIYYFVVYINIVSAYDGSHGSTDSLMKNTINIVMSQKLIIVSVFVLLIRLCKIISKKDSYHKFYDTMLLTGLAYSFGGFILKLDWNMYYVISVLFVSPPILYFTIKYLNIKYAFVIISLLAVFYIRNYPKNIKIVQNNRINTKGLIDSLREYKDNDFTFIWKDDLILEDSWDDTLSKWKKQSLSEVLSYEFVDDDFAFDDTVNSSERTLVFYPDEYNNYYKIPIDSSIIIHQSDIIILKKE